jgi:pyruvate kinase
MSDRCTKIVATIGPSSQDAATIARLLQAGVNVARLNFSHGTHDQHAEVIRLLRQTARQMNLPVAILQDLQGPKIRTGNLVNGSAELKSGQIFTLTTLPAPGDSNRVSVDFPDLPRAVRPGNRILLDDGNLELSVLAVAGEDVETRVILGGTLKPHKGVNLPGAALEIPGFTQKDQGDLFFGLDQGVDLIAISFVCSPKDIYTVRSAIQQHSGKTNVPVIAKLERPEALENLEEIILAADGVMVARGDLGVEMSPEAVPIAQKQIIASANQHGRVVITATQMLDSMINNPRPTRAEASDVANAIFDGTDAVMLSGETASGNYPVQAVEMMNKIICQAETHMAEWGHWQGVTTLKSEQDDTYFLTRAARELATDRNVAAIAVFTKSGRTARLMSKTRPEVPILAFTPDEAACNRMGLYWGVRPQVVPHVHTIEEMLVEVESAIVATTDVQPGQQVVLVCGFPVHAVRQTNLALLHTVGEKH